MRRASASRRHATLKVLSAMIVVVGVISLGSISVAHAGEAAVVDPSSVGEAIEPAEPIGSIVEAPVAPDGPVAGDDATEVVPASTGTWTLIGRENCYDYFTRSCTATFPQPQCAPGNPAGQLCSPVGSECWDTLSASSVNYYICTP